MKSRLLTAALGGLLLLGSGLALADDGGRGRYDRGGNHGWHDRGSANGPRWSPPRHYRGHGHGHFKPHWKQGHRFGHHRDYGLRDRHRYHRGHQGHHWKRYADRGDDITIIFRGSLD
ncbi:MAG TPA: hypothetical protein VD791_02660 [Burkholderiales bacterium]|nr:hypothetical protein [Burkholderiales bacterium]